MFAQNHNATFLGFSAVRSCLENASTWLIEKVTTTNFDNQLYRIDRTNKIQCNRCFVRRRSRSSMASLIAAPLSIASSSSSSSSSLSSRVCTSLAATRRMRRASKCASHESSSALRSAFVESGCRRARSCKVCNEAASAQLTLSDCVRPRVGSMNLCVASASMSREQPCSSLPNTSDMLAQLCNAGSSQSSSSSERAPSCKLETSSTCEDDNDDDEVANARTLSCRDTLNQ